MELSNPKPGSLIISDSPLRTSVPSVVKRFSPETGNAFFTIARVTLLMLLMAGPLAFGAVEPWAWGAITIVVACLLLLWAVGCVCCGAVRLIWSPLYVPAFALLALAAVQYWGGLSMDHNGTREALIKLATGILIFFLTQHLFGQQLALSSQHSARQKEFDFRSPDHPITRSPDLRLPDPLISVALVISIYTFVMSVFAIIQFFASPGVLYGTRKPIWGGWIFGPYVNHNHYAGLMEMLIPIAIGLALAKIQTSPQRHRATERFRDRR